MNVLCISLCCSCITFDIGAEKLREGWELFLTRNDRVNGTVKYRLTSNSSAAPDRDDLLIYGFEDGHGFGECHYRGSTNRSEVFGFNPKYAFSLDQDITKGLWRMNEVHTQVAPSLQWLRGQTQRNWLKGYMFELASVNENLVTDMRNNRVTLDAIVTSADRQWLFITFHACDGVAFEQRVTQGGVIKCYNQPPYFLPKEHKLTSAWPDPSLPGEGRRQATHLHEFDYDTSEELPRLLEARRSRNVPGLPMHSQVYQALRFELSEQPPAPERFYLTYYGLEEPHGIIAPTPPTPYWLYGTLGSIAVIVLGILLMRWSQRRSAGAAG